jgi:small subunit ribosomal protein S24e
MSSKGTVTIRPRKFLTNRLLERRQMILDVHHPNLATPDKETIKGMLAEYLSKAKGMKASSQATVIFGMKAAFGGGKSSCFALVYDSVDAAKKHEPKHRLMQCGHMDKPTVVVGRKQRKEKKNREKKFRGTRKEKRVRAQKN